MKRRSSLQPTSTPAPQAQRAPAPRVEPVIHIQAIRVPQPDGSILIRPGKPMVLGGDDEIGSAEAAKILGCEVDWVGRLCDRGDLIEGRDWRRIGRRGNYKLKRASVMRLSGHRFEETAA